jgi:hypothetical protein
MGKILSMTLCWAIISVMALTDAAFGSAALAKVSSGATTLHGIVAGPLGKLTLILGTLIGIFKSLQSGSILGALAILMIGILTSWHIDSMTTLFN